MAVIQQQPTFNQQAANIAQQKQLAELLRKSADQNAQNPNAQTGGPYSRVIPIHPLTAALRGLESGVSSYMASEATKQQGELEDAKQAKLQNMFSSGDDVGISELAQSGLVSGDALVNAMLKQKQAKQELTNKKEYLYLNSPEGVRRVNKYGEDVSLLPFKMSSADPTLAGEIQRAKTANQGFKLADGTGAEGLYSGAQANPQAFGNGQLLPNFESQEQPRPQIQPQPRQDFQFQFADPANLAAFINSPEGQQLLSQYQQPGGMVKSPSLEQKAAVDVNKQNQIDQNKTQQNLIEKKGEADIKLETNKAEKEQTRLTGANQTLDTVNNMMRYLYPNGQAVRDQEGRLVPPSEQMLLGTGPIDRLKMAGQNIGIHSDAATNTEMVRSKASDLARAALGGSLGSGVSNADVQFILKAQGVIDTAQDLKTLYSAIADLEDKAREIQARSQQQQGAPSGLTPEEQRELDELRARFKK
jgi:hypothetical protein